VLVPLLAAALALGSASAAGATLLYPNLKTLPPRNLRFDYTDVSPDGSGVLHHVLRFSNTAYNVGEGPLEIRATIDTSLNPPSGPAYQRVYDSGGGSTDIPLTGSTIYYHAVHKHYHFDHWGAYQLWTKAAYDNWTSSGVGSPDLVGTKTTSCVEDEELVAPIASAVWPARYPSSSCLPNAQNVIAEGLSPGWGDTYDYYRSEQWIDLGPSSSLPDGTYVLRSIADPDNIVYESPGKTDASREGAADNAAITVFSVRSGRLVDTNPPTGTVTIDHLASLTTSPNVSLDVLGRDDVSGVDQFQVSNDGTHWATYANTSYDSVAQTVSWDLTNATYGGTTATGAKTVYVRFHDGAGHWGPAASDTIDYDPRPPPVVQTSPYGQAVQGDAPVAWWRLGETSGTTAADEERSDPGTYAGGVARGRPSLLPMDPDNAAAAFDGTSGRVTVPDAPALALTDRFSLEAWIKPAALPASGSFASILSKPESYSLQFDGPRLEFTLIRNGTRYRLQAPANAVAPGTVHHVVGTFDGTTQRLYLDGRQVASAVPGIGAASVTTNALSIGSWDGTKEFFDGTIDEPAVYDAALSAARVAAHYAAATQPTAPPPPPPPVSYASTVLGDRPISYWRLDETSGSVAGDQRVANPGTFVGGLVLGVPGLIATDRADTAIGLDGTSGDVRIGQAGTLNLSNAMTLEAWIEPTVLPPAGDVRAVLSKSGAYALELDGPTLALTIVQLGARTTLAAPAGAIVAGRPAYVAGTWDGATMRLYVDGTQVASRSLGGAADQTLTGARIGSTDATSGFFAGTIDEPALYGVALSAAQIAAHYDAGGAIPPPPPATTPPLGATPPPPAAHRVTLAARLRPSRIRMRHGRIAATLVVRASAAGRARLTLVRLTPGIRRGRRCVATRHPHGRRCTIAKALGSRTLVLHAGRRALRLPTRYGRARLGPGRWQLVIALPHAKPVRLTFVVVR
jgi:concanavalin A-like lectin/glucanase superfamily protein